MNAFTNTVVLTQIVIAIFLAISTIIVLLRIRKIGKHDDDSFFK